MSVETARIINLVDTDLGRMAVQQSVVEDADVEDYLELKVISQGTILQMNMAAKNVDPTKINGKIRTKYYDIAKAI